MSLKLKAKGIFFDLDGTIVDSKPAYLEAARIAFTTLGKKPLENWVALEIPRRLEQCLAINDLVGDKVQQFLDIYLQAYYSVAKSKTKPFPSTQATLALLSKRAKLALITMRYVPRQSVIDELSQFSLAQFFTYFVTALDTEKPKPNPEALIRAVKKLDVHMCDCLMVGDSVADIRCGKAAGTKTVAVLTGLFTCDELIKENPDLILKDVSKLPGFLDFTD
ncbi:MAG TPA: HAD family hydrolase [Candidatus Sulfotelmatobacter sp.]|nr:HAD family hydrolase [Candidatus Sulfotelmatobacter sp.]